MAKEATYHHLVAELKYQHQFPSVNVEYDVAEDHSNHSPEENRFSFQFKERSNRNHVSWYSHLRPLLVQCFTHNNCGNDKDTAYSDVQLYLAFFILFGIRPLAVLILLPLKKWSILAGWSQPIVRSFHQTLTTPPNTGFDFLFSSTRGSNTWLWIWSIVRQANPFDQPYIVISNSRQGARFLQQLRWIMPSTGHSLSGQENPLWCWTSLFPCTE